MVHGHSPGSVQSSAKRAGSSAEAIWVDWRSCRFRDPSLPFGLVHVAREQTFAAVRFWPERADRLEAREQPLGAAPDRASDCFKNALGSTGPGHEQPVTTDRFGTLRASDESCLNNELHPAQPKC